MRVLKILKIFFIMLIAYRDLFMRGELSRTKKIVPK